MTDFLLGSAKQTDCRGRQAWNILATLCLDTLPEKNDEEGEMLGKLTDTFTFRDELGYLSGLIAEHADLSKQKIDWDKLWKQVPDGSRIKPSIDLLRRRQVAWAELLDYVPEAEVQAEREYHGIPLYGFDKPLTREQLKMLYVQSSGEWVREGRPPTTAELVAYKEQVISANERRTEYFFYKSNFEIWKKQLEPLGLSVEEMLVLGVQQLNRMSQVSDPPLDVTFKIQRIVVVDDSNLPKREDYPDGIPYGSDPVHKPNDFFINPITDSYPMISNVSPWSSDIHARWQLSYNFDNLPFFGSNVLELNNGDKTFVDGGMLHEQTHQLLFMGDHYWASNIGKKDTYGPESTIPDAFYQHFQCSGNKGGDITIGTPCNPIYPWSEEVYFKWLQQINPRVLPTYWKEASQTEETRPCWDAWQNKDLNLQIISNQTVNVLNVELIPMRVDRDNRIQLDASQGIMQIDGRKISEVLFGESTSNNIMISIKGENGKRWYLPLPRMVIEAGYYGADMENANAVDMHINLIGEPYTGSNYTDFKNYHTYTISEAEYTELKKNPQEKVIADISISHDGGKYYFVWCAPQQT